MKKEDIVAPESLPLLRPPCTCSTTLNPCPACRAWQRRHLIGESEDAGAAMPVPVSPRLMAHRTKVLDEIRTTLATRRTMARRLRRHLAAGVACAAELEVVLDDIAALQDARARLTTR